MYLAGPILVMVEVLFLKLVVLGNLLFEACRHTEHVNAVPTK